MNIAKRNLPILSIMLVMLATLILLAAPGLAHANTDLTAADIATQANADSESEAALDTQASSDKDIMLGVFFNSESDWANSIYASYDGKTLFRISETFKGGGNGNPYLDNHYAQYDPSIIYHDGYFWSLSGWNRYDGKIWLMISYSKDLVSWTHPEGLFNGNGISVNSLPVDLYGNSLSNFDTVAPEWSIGSDGNIYVIISAGYYGAFHGEPTRDAMQAYSIRVTHLSASDGYTAEKGYLWPNNLKFKSDQAKKISFTNYDSANFIDGALYAEGKTNYLIIKKDGLTNQLYKNSNPNNPQGWQLVNDEVSWGYEGPSIAKIAGQYHLFGDHVTGTTADGVRFTQSPSLTTKSPWPSFRNASFITQTGKFISARHGSVITLKANSEGWKVVKALLDKRSKKANSYTTKISIASLEAAGSGFDVSWSTQPSLAKYQIRYSTNKSMKESKIVTVTNKEHSAAIRDLSKGKQYYVQVRYVRNIGSVKHYSTWSTMKAVRTK